MKLFFKSVVLLFHGFSNTAHSAPLRNIMEEEKSRSLQYSTGDTTDHLFLWYKPHFQCGTDQGTNPQKAASFINNFMDVNPADFLGISEWTANSMAKIGSENYGHLGATCGGESLTTPISLFWDTRQWEIQSAYPPSPMCQEAFSSETWKQNSQSQYASCRLNDFKPDNGNCCSCTYSFDEITDLKTRDHLRPWAAGIFQHTSNSNKQVCVVVASIPHPVTVSWQSDRHACTKTGSVKDCVTNKSGTSMLYGTDQLVSQVTEFCGSVPIVFMADTNASGEHTRDLFLTQPLSELQDKGSPTPYTCCFTKTQTSNNRYPFDRIAVTGNLRIDDLRGGANHAGGSLPNDLKHQCYASEEHAPLTARISFTDYTNVANNLSPTTGTEADTESPINSTESESTEQASLTSNARNTGCSFGTAAPILLSLLAGGLVGVVNLF